jgi:glycerol-3-phosphate dehydrogenase (NAD(P)+)
MTRVAVLGAGSWGTALAIHLAREGHQVALWGHHAEQIEAFLRDGENRDHLPGVPLPPQLTPTSDLGHALRDADQVLVVVPSHAFEEVLQQVAEHVPMCPALAWATKGMDPHSTRPLSEIAKRLLPQAALTVLSGPTFAGEVARGLPTAITVASDTPEHALAWAELLAADRFRAYTSEDLIGVQIGGASKNVVAIAAGISDGLGFGANARAALITRGLAEISRLGAALGGRPETFMGLAGLGDLVLTCTDNQSRNRRMGLAIASGQSVATAKQQIGQEVEGVAAAREIARLAESLGIEMPITEHVQRILHGGEDPRVAAKSLLHRHLRAEQDAH